MIPKRIVTAAIIATLCVTQATTARAGSDGLVGGIVGGLIGGAIMNEANKNRQAAPQQRTVRQARPTGISSAQREANREVQVALNHFGFPVGTPDGAIGPKSRSAISQYQVLLGYPATGQLTEYERSHLVGSYHRAVAGGGLTMQQAATNPMGMKGLLVAWRDESMGVPSMPQPGTMAVAPAMPSFAAPAQPAPVAAAAPGLPSFMGGAATQASLASHCNKVALITSTNGGYTTLANLRDPQQALGEQFCLARGYAITQGEDLATKVAGVTAAEIAQQCEGFAPAMKDHVAALSMKTRDEVLSGVSAFALSTGMAPAQLAGTARICLSVGYRTDNMDVAVGSALLLTALGEKPYAELLGHHLAMGFGASQRPDLALDWYQAGFDALGGGSTAVFAPGQPERTDLIRKAAYTLGGRVDAAPVAPVPASALPGFAVPAPVAPVPVAVPVPLPPMDVQGQLPPAQAPATLTSAAQAGTVVMDQPAPTPGAQPVGVATGMVNLIRLPTLLIQQ